MPAVPNRAVLIACAIAAVVGAAALPLWRPGVGWLAAAIAVGLAGLVARSANASTPAEVDGGGPAPEEPAMPETVGDRVWRSAAASAAVVLIAVPAVRAAPWLDALCLATGAVLGCYAIAGGRTLAGIVGGLMSLVPATGYSVGWAITAGRGRVAVLPRLLAGLAAGLLLLLVFGALLVNADWAFGDLVRSSLEHISVSGVLRALFGLVLVGLAALMTAYRVTRTRIAATPVVRERGLGLVEWATPVVMLNVLFGVFVFVQLTVLFGGDAYVLGPGGPDYAAYARGGFIQLMAVTALTLGVVAALALWAARSTPAQRWTLRLLGGLLCLLTLVIVTSALTRLGLYAQAYGFTAPRLLGYAAEVWLGLVFGLIIIAGVGLRAAWLPRAGIAAGVGVLIALAAINPEALMARTHVARLDHSYPIDQEFLDSLSTDAIDEIPWARCTAHMKAAVRDEPWYAWTYSHAYARALMATPRACDG